MEEKIKDATHMMYPYMTLNDDTEVTHSQVLTDGSVKVYIETPVEGGFKNLTCILPMYQFENHGYDADELKHWKEFVQNNAHIIMELAKGGGFVHAAAGKTTANATIMQKYFG